jgi:3-dehydroquinate synthase class II
MRTGDIVRAVQRRGMYAGTHVGRVTIRQRPSFCVNGHDFHPRLLTVLQRADGYDYTI